MSMSYSVNYPKKIAVIVLHDQVNPRQYSTVHVYGSMLPNSPVLAVRGGHELTPISHFFPFFPPKLTPIPISSCTVPLSVLDNIGCFSKNQTKNLLRNQHNALMPAFCFWHCKVLVGYQTVPANKTSTLSYTCITATVDKYTDHSFSLKRVSRFYSWCCTWRWPCAVHLPFHQTVFLVLLLSSTGGFLVVVYCTVQYTTTQYGDIPPVITVQYW